MKSLKIKRNNKPEFTEENVLKLLDENGYISSAMIQHKFSVGYAQAAEMIDTLAEKGYVKLDGHKWVKAK